jgi:hypothetical protein
MIGPTACCNSAVTHAGLQALSFCCWTKRQQFPELAGLVATRHGDFMAVKPERQFRWGRIGKYLAQRESDKFADENTELFLKDRLVRRHPRTPCKASHVASSHGASHGVRARMGFSRQPLAGTSLHGGPEHGLWVVESVEQRMGPQPFRLPREGPLASAQGRKCRSGLQHVRRTHADRAGPRRADAQRANGHPHLQVRPVRSGHRGQATKRRAAVAKGMRDMGFSWH